MSTTLNDSNTTDSFDNTVVVLADPTTPTTKAQVSNYFNKNRVATDSIISGNYAGSPVAVAVDPNGRLITSNEVVSVLPSAKVSFFGYLNAGVTDYETYSITSQLAIKLLISGGTGTGTSTLAKYVAATTAFVNQGDFESAGAFGTTWVASSPGTGLTSWSQSNTQFFTGSFSGRVVYSKSDSNNYVNIKQTFSPVVDYSTWRYISARFYHDAPTGGAQTRTVSIILTSTGGATRTYSTSFQTTQAAGWVQVLGEIENPTSTTGTGFDISDISSIDLRFIDGGNKAGTIYWDTVRLTGSITTLLKSYFQANTTNDIALDPVEVFNVGDVLMLITKNTDTARKEYSTFVSGVSLL
jgi:hypothetical protein